MPSITCYRCSGVNPANATFCNHCGAHFRTIPPFIPRPRPIQKHERPRRTGLIVACVIGVILLSVLVAAVFK